ncbi:MAG: hypothetical protein HRU20_30385 [Pseudomonadales bacterium]|nr:hypothetical protein [Pseudomonadales bacterium]
MKNCIRFQSSNKNQSEAVFDFEGKAYVVDVGFDYSEGLVFIDRKLLIVFQHATSNQGDFVAKCFKINGEYQFDIPFPELKNLRKAVIISYRWYSSVDNGLKIVFGADAVGFRDFWCDFDFDKQDYVKSDLAY